MKKVVFTLFLLSLILSAAAQRKKIDTLRAKLNGRLDDSTHINVLLDLSLAYYLANPDSTILFGQQAYALAEKGKFLAKEARALNGMAVGYGTLGDYPRGTQLIYSALRISESLHDVFSIVRGLNNLGDTYMRQGNYRKALNDLLPADKQWQSYSYKKVLDSRGSMLSTILILNIGECYLNLKVIDSADYYLQQSYKIGKRYSDIVNNIYRDFGEVEIARGHTEKALKYLSDAIRASKAIDDQQMLSESYLSEAKLYHNNKQQDSAKFYAQKALNVAQGGGFEQDVLNAGKVLYRYYDEDQNLPLAYKYFKLATAAKDSLYSQDRVKQLMSLDFEEKQRQREIAAAQEQYRAAVRMYALIAGLVVLLLLVIIFWRNSSQRKAANQLLQKQKEEIQNTLGELKTTQNQLVQSAKMASLGELTAGIAHEIQNPLNFVNNFSEVNKEMLEELKAESEKPKAQRDEQAETELINSLIENEQKINHHGKRADAIVKGMLQHSQSGTGAKELTNINGLADECMRLAYHGLRAKDKTFNAELITHLDQSLPKVNVIPQDMVRVMLNLSNNAFYAVNQKAKTAGADYKPEVSVTTSSENSHVIITVKDNGVGIADAIKEKIMQPFFTTKPTGEGTGLGLSLTYDMVVKGHGGSIDVDTRENEYSLFIIKLPLS